LGDELAELLGQQGLASSPVQNRLENGLGIGHLVLEASHQGTGFFQVKVLQVDGVTDVEGGAFAIPDSESDGVATPNKAQVNRR
jgi:hypothetical protein